MYRPITAVDDLAPCLKCLAFLLSAAYMSNKPLISGRANGLQMTFTKDADGRRDPNINRKGRGSAPATIAALCRDLAEDFPDVRAHEKVMLRNAASLVYRSERCRDSAVAHRCADAARKIITTLRTQRAAAVAALPPPPEVDTLTHVKAALAEMERQEHSVRQQP
jgi:hypothetical protein